MAQTANSTVPFNATGGSQSSSSTNAASAQCMQNAIWYAMQQQAANAASTNSSIPAGAAAALASVASSANASTSSAMCTGGRDLAVNYQNYLSQYQQQHPNASQQALAGMGGSSTAPSGVPPPTVGVPLRSGNTASSQVSAALNAAFYFGYPNQQPGAFGQMVQHPTVQPATLQHKPRAPTPSSTLICTPSTSQRWTISNSLQTQPLRGLMEDNLKIRIHPAPLADWPLPIFLDEWDKKEQNKRYFFLLRFSVEKDLYIWVLQENFHEYFFFQKFARFFWTHRYDFISKFFLNFVNLVNWFTSLWLQITSFTTR